MLRSFLGVCSKSLKTIDYKTFDEDTGKQKSESPSPSKDCRSISQYQFFIFFFSRTIIIKRRSSETG